MRNSAQVQTQRKQRAAERLRQARRLAHLEQENQKLRTLLEVQKIACRRARDRSFGEQRLSLVREVAAQVGVSAACAALGVSRATLYRNGSPTHRHPAPNDEPVAPNDEPVAPNEPVAP